LSVTAHSARKCGGRRSILEPLRTTDGDRIRKLRGAFDRRREAD